jgi:hypothetical protein
MEAEAFDVFGGENEIVPEGHFVPEKSNFAAGGVTARGELPLLVVLAVIWQKGFWDYPQDGAAINDDCAVK